MERTVCQKMYDYLNHLIISNKSGFRPMYSTVTQLLEIYDEILKALDTHKQFQFIFFDISKAFDRVWHKGLLHKLEQFGIQNNLLNWIANYLYNSKQKLVLHGLASNLKMTAGVPQGSILGPLNFLSSLH